MRATTGPVGSFVGCRDRRDLRTDEVVRVVEPAILHVRDVAAGVRSVRDDHAVGRRPSSGMSSSAAMVNERLRKFGAIASGSGPIPP